MNRGGVAGLVSIVMRLEDSSLPARMKDAGVPTFHERLRLQQCLLHSLNNLFQEHTCSAADLDAIANQLAPGRLPILHPHRTLFLGNWDVNVLELALRRHGKELHWVDLRDLSFAQLDLDACWGLLLNVRGKGTLTRILGGRHWLALKRFGQHWWNLDSMLATPQPVASRSDAAAAADGNSRGAATGSTPAADGVSSSSRFGDQLNATEDAPPAASVAETAKAIADAAVALRRFLAQQVQERDGKVFRIVDSRLASHPLPDAAS